MLESCFITGTDTSVGKTWAACPLLRQLPFDGMKIRALPPVDEDDLSPKTKKQVNSRP